ncbi:MAG: radical SAM protein [Candidatus Methanofastidiosia archaeon]|jgi:radical SAM protein with 4Fe4S-binding SPASM domain
MKEYPVLKEDIFFAKILNGSQTTVIVRNTITEKDFSVTKDTVTLLELCTGTHTIKDICVILSELSSEPADVLVNQVSTALKILKEKNIIVLNAHPLSHSMQPAKIIKTTYVPHTAQIEITNKCNLSCLHCFNNSGDPCPDELTTEEILCLIDTLSTMGVYEITLTGGEPMVHPDIFTIVEHARKTPMKVTIFTNGTLIKQEHIKKFGKGVKFVVSVDSCYETIHDTFRGKKGALKKTLDSICLLKDGGYPVRVSISLNNMNKNEIVDTIAYLREHEIDDYQVAEVSISGRGIDEVALTPDKYYDALVEQLLYEKKVKKMAFHAPKEEGGCGIARNLIYITADGTILPCHACCKDMGVGNVRDVDLPAFWDKNETLEMLRQIRAEQDEMCKDCEYVSFCDGCIGNAFIFEGEFRTYDPYACARFKAYESVELLKFGE